MKRLLAGFVFVVVACAPIQEDNCYDSALSYLQDKKNPECLVRDEGEYQLFKESEPIVVRRGELEVTYAGNVDGSGYCLTPAFDGIKIRSYCTLNDDTLDACIWTDVSGGKTEKVVQLRSENPDGCNRQPWNVLETVFEQTKHDFLENKSSDFGYREAVERVMGSI